MHAMPPTLPEMTLVESSRISAVGWRDGRLYVWFRTGHIWKFGDRNQPVGRELFERLLGASSKGQYFYPYIHNRFPGICLTTGESRRPGGDLMVASPLYLLLLQARKLMRAKPGTKIRYAIWTVCGKEDTGKPGTKYAQCLKLLAEAQEDLEGAIELAKTRRI